MNSQDESEFAELVQVVAGNPTKEELVAVIAVLQEASKRQQNMVPAQLSTWARNDSILRTGIVVGNGQWGSMYRQGL